MLSKQIIWGNLIGLGVLILVISGVQANQIPSEHSILTPQFHYIEQPLGLKVVVTLGGLGLIGLELWWFLFSHDS